MSWYKTDCYKKNLFFSHHIGLAVSVSANCVFGLLFIALIGRFIAKKWRRSDSVSNLVARDLRIPALDPIPEPSAPPIDQSAILNLGDVDPSNQSPSGSVQLRLKIFFAKFRVRSIVAVACPPLRTNLLPDNSPQFMLLSSSPSVTFRN